MRKISYLLLLVVVAFSACKQSFKKAKDGSEFMVISGKNGKLVTAGNIIEMEIMVKYKDSVLYSTYETGMPQYAPYDTAQFPESYKEIFRTLHVGDSIVIKMPTDTLIKMGQSAPFMQKGNFVIQNYKVKNAFATQAEADKAREAAMSGAEMKMKAKSEEQIKKDDKILQDYFAKNNIKAVKAPLGTYVQILTPGTGANIDTSVVAKINYTGKTLDGKVFDSNTDPSKGHMEPLLANMTTDQNLGLNVISGWKDGLTLLNKGAKAKLYIPSSLAYGPTGAGNDIGPNAVLMFDVEVLDVLSRAQAAQAAVAMRSKMEAMQKHYMDSIQKTMPDTSKMK